MGTMTRRRTPTDKKKLFVMDTNVILHDARCLHTFAEHDIAIPITVLEELDRFKKGQNDLNFQAREFLRNLDDLTGDLLSKEGAPLGAGHGHVRVVIPTQLDPRIREVFLRDEPDNRIVNASLYLSNIHPDHQVILVSKDTNIRLKAKALGLVAQDYIRDALESVDQLYRGIRSQDIESEKIDRFYGAELPMASEIPIESPNANENFILRSG